MFLSIYLSLMVIFYALVSLIACALHIRIAAKTAAVKLYRRHPLLFPLYPFHMAILAVRVSMKLLRRAMIRIIETLSGRKTRKRYSMYYGYGQSQIRP